MPCNPMRASLAARALPLLSCILVHSPVTARESSPRAPQATVDVTWPDLVRLVDAHPRLAASISRIEAARAGIAAAGAVPNPSLATQLGQGHPRAGGPGTFEWGLTLNLPMGWLAQRRSRVSAAAAEVDVAVAEAMGLRRDVLTELQTLFWKVALEQARVAALEDLQIQTLALVRTIQRKVDAGDARPVEATRVEIEFEKVGAEAEAARVLTAGGQRQLGLWLGVARARAAADLISLPAGPWATAADSPPHEDHPTLAAARARVRALEAEVQAERLARVPAFSLTGFTAHELDRNTYGVGLALDLPLWNWNSGRIAQTRANLEASRRSVDAASVELEGTIIEAQAACLASAATAKRMGAAVVPRAQTAATTMERTYRLGEASLLELIDSRRSLLDAHRLYLSALGQAHIDCARFTLLLGEDSR